MDINATKTAILLDLNRSTINNWFNVFRRRIYIHQEAIKEQIIGNVEVDEARQALSLKEIEVNRKNSYFYTVWAENERSKTWK